MVQLPAALLENVHDRVLTGLAQREGGEVPSPLAREVADRVIRYLRNTAETTVSVQEEGRGDPAMAGTTFVITGDIPAMWLRDSAAQLTPLLRLVAAGIGTAAERAELVDLLAGLLRRHWRLILIDAYANAFNRGPDGAEWSADESDQDSPWVWERKFELDSLSYGVDLAWRLWRATGDTTWADEDFPRAAARIMDVVGTEQDHEARSPYFFRRADCAPSDTLVRDGRGREVVPTGMVWAGFRPSDDAVELGYNIPGNHYLALALERMGDLLAEVVGDAEAADRARELSRRIRAGLQEKGLMPGPAGEPIWAYEVDGRGQSLFMDDANVPSLLSLPYLGCADAEDPVYRATRAAVLSEANPYHYAGSAIRGVGSPHTPVDHVWPIAVAIQGLTSADDQEKRELLAMLIASDGGTGMMHEGVHIEDPTRFTREWFSWSNAMFCELALDAAGVRPLDPDREVTDSRR